MTLKGEVCFVIKQPFYLLQRQYSTVSRRVESNLEKLLRKWGLKLLNYKGLFLRLMPGINPWWIDLMFYRYLSASCIPIGRAFGAVYMRCDNRLAYFSTSYMAKYYHVEGVKVLESDIKKIGELRALTKEEVDKLRDRLADVSVDFREFIKFGIYGSEPIYLLKLGDIDLFLAKVEVDFNTNVPVIPLLIKIEVDAATPTNEVLQFVSVRYALRENGALELGEIIRGSLAEQMQKTRRTIVGETLETLDEKYLAMDGLLRGLEEVILNGIKALAITLLY